MNSTRVRFRAGAQPQVARNSGRAAGMVISNVGGSTLRAEAAR